MSTQPPPKPRTATGDHLRPVADDHIPVTQADVDDAATLPQLMRLIAGELRDLGATVRERVMPALSRLADSAAEDRAFADQQFQRLHARLDELQARVVAK